ncbi:small nuclear ribonucleoprotein F [Nematocida sp. AWRm77]|nr:small nuclear ribonucleoprotein F [Nematocida sp. AWRm77]
MNLCTPMNLLWSLQGQRVRVHLKWGEVYTGTLVSSDEYFNVHLSEAETEKGAVGNCVIRCNNLVYLYKRD